MVILTPRLIARRDFDAAFSRAGERNDLVAETLEVVAFGNFRGNAIRDSPSGVLREGHLPRSEIQRTTERQATTNAIEQLRRRPTLRMCKDRKGTCDAKRIVREVAGENIDFRICRDRNDGFRIVGSGGFEHAFLERVPRHHVERPLLSAGGSASGTTRSPAICRR